MDPLTIGAATLAAPAVLDGVGNLWDSIFGNDEEEAHQKALKQAQQKMLAYRPEIMNARMQGMGQMAHAFVPINNMLTSAYGPSAAFDMSKIVQNPFAGIPQQKPRDRTPKIGDNNPQYIGDPNGTGGISPFTDYGRHQDNSSGNPYFDPEKQKRGY